MGLAGCMFLIHHTHALASPEPELIVNQMLKPGRTAVMHRKLLDVSLNLKVAFSDNLSTATSLSLTENFWLIYRFLGFIH